jgi:hypothetical protein
MGYVMELLAADGARSWTDFATGLKSLQGKTAWSTGSWDFGDGDARRWNMIQNINRDILALTHYLTSIVRADIRKRRETSAHAVDQSAVLETADS